MEEYIDILDQKGNQTGKTKLKSQAHKDGGLHKSAHIWIINSQNKLLIQKRAPDNDCYQNTWDISSAGHLAAGEQSIDSAIREIDEELGLKLKKENLEYLFSLTCNQITNKGTFINNEFNDVYLVRLDLNINKINVQKEELSEVKWIDFKELEKLINNKDENFVQHDEEYKKLFAVLRKKYK